MLLKDLEVSKNYPDLSIEKKENGWIVANPPFGRSYRVAVQNDN